MKKLVFGVITLLLVAAFTMTSEIQPALAQPTETHSDSIWLEPSNLTGPIGTRFMIYCWVNVSTIGYSYQVKITWNSSIFQLDSFVHTAGDCSGYDWLDQRDPGPNGWWESVTLVGPLYGINWAKLGGTCLGDDFVPANTVGMLYRAQFEVIASPSPRGRLDTYISVDEDSTYILDTDLDTVPTTKYGSHYYYEPVKPADLNEDGVVDMQDIGIAASAFGSYPSHPRWNPIADINKDDAVNMRDIALIARHFGETDP